MQALLAQLKGQRCDGPRAQGLNTCLDDMTTVDSRYSFPLLPSLILVLLHVRMTAKSACQSELTLTPLLPSTPEYVAVKWRNKKGAGGKERRWEGGEKGKQVQRGRAPRYTNRKPFEKILRTSPSSTFYFFCPQGSSFVAEIASLAEDRSYESQTVSQLLLRLQASVVA